MTARFRSEPRSVKVARVATALGAVAGVAFAYWYAFHDVGHPHRHRHIVEADPILTDEEEIKLLQNALIDAQGIRKIAESMASDGAEKSVLQRRQDVV